MTTPPAAPRRIDPAATFQSIVNWLVEDEKVRNAPGLIVGVSGTDSILTFLAAARAMEKRGMGQRALALNFDHTSHNEPDETKDGIRCVSSTFNWVAQDIFPWLKEQAPQARFEIDDSIPHSDDNIRWGHLFSRAVSETNPRHGLSGSHYFPVGTRNATELALGNYSQLSRNVSLQPIEQLYKTEVLQICDYLGVPQIAIDKSREIDCDCGRFETQAHHMDEVDLFIMEKKGLLPKGYAKEHMAPDIYAAVVAFYVEETWQNTFREETPYRPQRDLVVTL